jgi:hypothetical protein
MLSREREQKILTTIHDITGVTPPAASLAPEQAEADPRTNTVTRILIFSTTYDYFLLTEESRLPSLFADTLPYRLTHDPPPRLTHVETPDDCLDYLKKRRCDLLIIFNPSKDLDVPTLATTIKKNSDAAIMVLSNNTSDLQAIEHHDTTHAIDSYFTWNGDGKIILTMVQYLEDKTNSTHLTPTQDYDLLLLIEDSIHAYSAYLNDIYNDLRRHTDAILPPEATIEEKLECWRQRPFILHTTTITQAQTLLTLHDTHLIGVITDNNLPDTTPTNNGAHLAIKLRTQHPTLPILLQSSEPIKTKLPNDPQFFALSKNDPHLTTTLHTFLNTSLGPTSLILSDAQGKHIEPITTMREFEDAIVTLPATTLKTNATTHLFSRWLRARGERILADKLEPIETANLDDDALKQRLVDTIEEHRYQSNQIQVTQFLRENQGPSKQISRIGEGALGGKARGLAFLSKLLSTYLTDEMTPGIHITLPRSIVLSTDIFDAYITQNHILDPTLFDLPDERITAKFMDASLPPTVLGDLRAFIRNTRKPLIIRSSGMLEDSLMQPFAGIYASILLPNESWETDFRFQDVCNAVKYVYSSTYSQRARTYIRNTPKNIRDEKMAVLIQEVVGERHGPYFYPTISGVAKSYNYYPTGTCQHEDGIVYLAVGLGKAIVDGGSSFCFCPQHPRNPLYGTPKDFIKYSQTHFYALNLQSIYRIVEKNEDTTLKSLDIKIARDEGLLTLIASTYLPRDDTLYPGLSDDGVMVLDFGPMLSYDTLPLARALTLLMRISELALGYPVEIEFAVNIPTTDTQPAELVILQVRNMRPKGKHADISLHTYNPDTDLCFSDNALGNGIIDNLTDIVYITPESFDLANTQRTVEQLRAINTTLMDQNRPYILIGPGRWGSSDPWLGIPVQWSDIAGAKVILETPVKARIIEPSQGSHFFHDMMAGQVGYLMTKSGPANIHYDWLETLPVLTTTQDTKHVRSPEPLIVLIDGKTGKAALRKQTTLKNPQENPTPQPTEEETT